MTEPAVTEPAVTEPAVTEPAVTEPAVAGGPWFEELAVGQVFDTAPACTLTSGQAAVHQSIVGDRLRLPLDDELSVAVLGARGFAHPALVWDIAIGQSTVATQRVKANLFYRGLVFRRAPVLGDTLRTTTRVAGLRQNRAREGRAPTGLAVLRITTVDQLGRRVLDFYRCAMLPLRDAGAQTGHADDLAAVGSASPPGAFAELVRDWRVEPQPGLPRGRDLRTGQVWEVAGGDVVSSAPQLARLTLNIAAVHHDADAAGGRRLVYGGHTIALALSQACRALPALVTVAGWHGCDHTGPVHEGDTLYSSVEIERVEPLPGASLVHLRSRVAEGSARRPVLDWRFVAIVI